MTLFANNCIVTRGDSDLLSIITNSANEIDPINRKPTLCGEPVTIFPPGYDSNIRNEVIAAASAIVPFMSISCNDYLQDHCYPSLIYCQSHQ